VTLDDHGTDRPDDELDARLRDWGRRPPPTPGGVVARRVVARATSGTPRRSRVAARRLATLSGALAALLLAAWWGLGPRPDTPGSHAVPGDLPPVLPENVVQFWLDPETPVYFVTGPAGPGERGSP
jgi:hypothetical protein